MGIVFWVGTLSFRTWNTSFHAPSPSPRALKVLVDKSSVILMVFPVYVTQNFSLFFIFSVSVTIRWGKALFSFVRILSKIFSMPLQQQSSSIPMTHRFGLFTGLYVLEFPVLASYYFIFVLVGLFQFLQIFFKFWYSMNAPWLIQSVFFY